MRKRMSPDEQFDRMHWESLVRTIIDQIGPERLAEIIDYIADEMLAERRKLHDFAIECRRVEH